MSPAINVAAAVEYSKRLPQELAVVVVALVAVGFGFGTVDLVSADLQLEVVELPLEADSQLDVRWTALDAPAAVVGIVVAVAELVADIVVAVGGCRLNVALVEAVVVVAAVGHSDLDCIGVVVDTVDIVVVVDLVD